MDYIKMYLDFSSPYSAIALLHIFNDHRGIYDRLDIQPIILASVYDQYDSSPAKQPLKYAYELEDIPRTAKHLGLPKFGLPKTFPSSPIIASRLFYGLASSDRVASMEYCREVFRRYFRSDFGGQLSDAAIKAFGKMTISDKFQNEILVDNQIKQFVREKTDRAMSNGIFGCPMFVSKDEKFWGCDRIDQLICSTV